MCLWQSKGFITRELFIFDVMVNAILRHCQEGELLQLRFCAFSTNIALAYIEHKSSQLLQDQLTRLGSELQDPFEASRSQQQASAEV